MTREETSLHFDKLSLFNQQCKLKAPSPFKLSQNEAIRLQPMWIPIVWHAHSCMIIKRPSTHDYFDKGQTTRMAWLR